MMSKPGAAFLQLDIDDATVGRHLSVQPGWFHRKNWYELANELKEGKCALSLEKEKCLRAVQIALLNITDENGARCMQIGKLFESEVTIDMKLPGSKVQAG